MPDPYEILGVKRGDSADVIRKAYRKLAKRHHPDVNPGKPEALERFKAISGAYDLLGDETKRARFDRGEIDADGHERAPPPPPPRWNDFAADAPNGFRGAGAGGAAGIRPEDLEGLFGAAFSDRMGRARGGANIRGSDVHYTLSVPFLDAANGTTRRVTLPDGRTLDVKIPAGIRDGHLIRLRGQGSPGFGEGPAGDALVQIGVVPNPLFQVVGDDVVLELPVTLQEAVLGATIEVPTVKGSVRLAIPAGSGSGTRLRLKGRGVGAGHQYVQLQVVVPPGDDPALAEFLRRWQPAHPIDPRAGLDSGGKDG
jgi:DnaJ-class molecular chaperone